jgi:hypothetical protein
LGEQRVTTRPQHRQPGPPAPHHHHPSSRAPPSGARGLVRAGHPLVLAGWRDIVVRDLRHRRSRAASRGGCRRSRRCTDRHGRGLRHDRRGLHGSAAVTACYGSAAVTARSGSVAVTAYCDSAAAAALHGPSLAAVVVLSAARDALDERRLVGMAASDLNTLALRGGHGGRHPANVKTRKLNSRSSRRCGIRGSGGLPQGGEAPLPLPWGLGRRCDRGRCGHRRTPSRPRGVPRCLRGARRLSRRLPGSGCSRARPRRCLLCVTTPPEIISYNRLNHSIWSLSDNKESSR